MAEKTVLILGQRPDPHIDKVEKNLNKFGCKVIVFDRWEASQGITCEFSEHNNVLGKITTGEREVKFNEITSVWWRIKPVRSVDFGLPQNNYDEIFSSREWMEMLRSLSELIKDAFWINILANQIRAGYKPYQLQLAKSLGLSCPLTIITNRNTEVLNLFDSGTSLIYKTLSSFVIPPNEIIFTNEITREQITNAGNEIALAPCIFQQKMDKSYEARVTIVGEKIFAVGIDSQTDEITKVDWRRNQNRDMYFKMKLSSQTEKALLNFHQKAGLVFATYDFIITPDNKEIFLECNPGGQWLWLEEILDIEISMYLAKVLAEGKVQ